MTAAPFHDVGFHFLVADFSQRLHVDANEFISDIADFPGRMHELWNSGATKQEWQPVQKETCPCPYCDRKSGR